jgi:hypothetical protein
MLFKDPDALQKMIFLKRDPKRRGRGRQESDRVAEETLPTKTNSGTRPFSQSSDERAGQLQRLLLPHIGNAMVNDDSQTRRMADLKDTAPQLETANIEQIAALPLGGRIRVDPWNDKVEMLKAKPVALTSAREKMPFEVAPVHLYLTRQAVSDGKAQPAAVAAKKPEPRSRAVRQPVRLSSSFCLL